MPLRNKFVMVDVFVRRLSIGYNIQLYPYLTTHGCESVQFQKPDINIYNNRGRHYQLDFGTQRK